MYSVSDEQIEFILNDIKQRGVEMEDLQNNLLDHICCLLEKNYKEGDDFETLYNSTIKQFFKHALWEIEEETILLLKYKNYYKMKRFLYILLFLSLGYNIYVFSMLGYEYYKQKQWQSQINVFQKLSYEEGFNALKKKLKNEHPEFLRKPYIYVSFSRNYWEHEPSGFSNYTYVDTEFVNSQRRYQIKDLKLSDSIASKYSNNISYIYVYSHNGNRVDKEIDENKTIAGNLTYITGVPELRYGYQNKKVKKGLIFIPTTIIIDTTGKLIYEHGIAASRIDKKLFSFLKSIQ